MPYPSSAPHRMSPIINPNSMPLPTLNPICYQSHHHPPLDAIQIINHPLDALPAITLNVCPSYHQATTGCLPNNKPPNWMPFLSSPSIHAHHIIRPPLDAFQIINPPLDALPAITLNVYPSYHQATTGCLPNNQPPIGCHSCHHPQ